MLVIGMKYNTLPEAEALVLILPDRREITIQLLPRDPQCHNRLGIDAPRDVEIERRPVRRKQTAPHASEE